MGQNGQYNFLENQYGDICTTFKHYFLQMLHQSYALLL